MAVVGDRLWVFNKSDSDHRSSRGAVRDASTMGFWGHFRHNLSHAATVDYWPATDTMVVGNAGDTTSAAPRIDLLPGFSRYGVNAMLDWNAPDRTPRISIPLAVHAADGRTMLRSIFPDKTRVGASAVWLDGRTLLVFSASSTTALTAATVALGTGDDDYSTEGFGAFTAGRAQDQYNGTAKLIATYQSSITGITQGADWWNDRLYLGWTASSPSKRGLEVLELSFSNGGRIETVRRWFHQPKGADGAVLRFETQGVVLRGGDLIVSGIRLNDEYQSIYRFTNTDTAIDLSP